MSGASVSMRAAVFDIDGTLAVMDKVSHRYTALPGAIAAIAACRAAGLKTFAYTNGTFYPPRQYYPLLSSAGLGFDDGHILTPASVAATFLAEQGHSRIMVLGADGTRLPLEEAGLNVVGPKPDTGEVDAVLIGWTSEFGLPDLEAVCEAVWNGARLYTVSDAPYFASAKGRMLGVSGAISAMVAQATEQRPMVIGKPSTLGLKLISKLLDVEPSEMLVIGDDPKLEIRMAREAGALAIGVTTGIADAAAFETAPEAIRAQLVLQGLQEFNESIWR